MKKPKLMSAMTVFLLGINSIIGSGIFMLAGKIYKDAGSLSLLAIVLASLSILVISFSYANMAKIYPENGGAFVYAKDTFGRFAGYLVGMGVWIQGTVTLAAEVAALMTAAQMLNAKLPVKSLGIGLILILGFVSYFGAGLISKLDNITSLVKIGIVLIFVVATAWLVKSVNFQAIPSARSGSGLLAAYGTVFFFYPGFAFLPVNAEKMKNPNKTLPRMLLAVILTSMLIYLAIHAITIGVLGAGLSNVTVPAAVAFSKIVGSIGTPLIVSGICISIFGVIVTASFNAPTILASLAKDHEDVPIQVAMEHYKISAINFVGYSSGATGVINYMMETSKDKNYPPVANFISLDGEYNSCKYGYKKQELSHIMTSAPDKKTAMYRYIEANYQKLNPKIRVYLMEGNNLTKSGQLTDGTIPWGDSFSIYHLLQKNGNPVSIYIYPTKVAHSLLPKEKTVQNYIKNLLY